MPICIGESVFILEIRVCWLIVCTSRGPSLFEDLDELEVAAGNFRDGGLECCLPGSKVDQRLPKIGSTDGKTDKAFHAGGDG